ncbi:PaaX family transcriptional regulator C-terminal domain-containing protein [Nonomuraea pusilla]|uniref:PaaX-like protein C-terminal domain-containing protein n=1 Tax=Nonomuraea pusilla TaxID=46177 RepID=A0A1H7PD10_9ACTN|nr:PaaX family transcriptional regulator C-terminal domain-containing protein [Nonomuraea pusilla]SEL33348.1 PaaX-like protein C-terminal domain-containing protein [Nonomuraea pusilla]
MGLGVGFVTHAFRQDAALTFLGGVAVHGGLYLSPDPWEPYVEEHARRLDVLGHVTFLTTRDLRRGEEADPVALARALWPLDEIAGRYDRLAAVAEPRLRALQDHPEPSEPRRLTIAVEPAAEFTRAMEADPLLPPELLPRPWSGARARTLTARCWSLLEERTGEDDGAIRLFSLYGGLSRLAAGA